LSTKTVEETIHPVLYLAQQAEMTTRYHPSGGGGKRKGVISEKGGRGEGAGTLVLYYLPNLTKLSSLGEKG